MAHLAVRVRGKDKARTPVAVDVIAAAPAVVTSHVSMIASRAVRMPIWARRRARIWALATVPAAVNPTPCAPVWTAWPAAVAAAEASVVVTGEASAVAEVAAGAVVAEAHVVVVADTAAELRQ